MVIMPLSNPVKHEQWYPLVKDPGIHAIGMKIGARMIINLTKSPMLRIVFKTSKHEAEVECSPTDLRPFDEKPWTLAPTDLFELLNSYVAGIAEVGIRAIFATAWDAGDVSTAFHTFLQKGRVFQAISSIARTTAIELCAGIIDDALRAGVPRKQLEGMKYYLAEMLRRDTNVPPRSPRPPRIAPKGVFP